MDLLILVVVLCLVGFAIWLLTTKIPMPDYWATAIQVLVVVVIVLYMLSRVVEIPNLLPK